MSAAPSPTHARVAAAPVRSKKKPAYAHSFTRGKPGTTMAIAPSSFHQPRMTAKYGGEPPRAGAVIPPWWRGAGEHTPHTQPTPPPEILSPLLTKKHNPPPQ